MKQLNNIRSKIKQEENKQKEVTTEVILNLKKVNGNKYKGRNECLIPQNLKLKMKTKNHHLYSNILDSKRTNKNGNLEKN